MGHFIYALVLKWGSRGQRPLAGVARGQSPLAWGNFAFLNSICAIWFILFTNIILKSSLSLFNNRFFFFFFFNYVKPMKRVISFIF